MIRTAVRLNTLTSVIFFLPLLSGCGSSDGGGPKLAPVTGRVIFKNEAVTAGDIFFVPDAEKGNRGEMASAILQTDGSFTMETMKGKANAPGVIPGAYKVTVRLGRRPEPELKPYADAKTTTLSIEVPEQGIQGHVFELK